MRSFMSFFVILFFSAVLSQDALAKVWVLNNNPGGAGDFTDFTTAHTTAADGDTIYVVGSNTSYGIASIGKTLTIIGPGYFLNENLGNQASALPAAFSQITFQGTGLSNDTTLAAGSSLIGLTVGSAVPTLNIAAANITIKRCRITGEIRFTQQRSGAVFVQNFIESGITASYTNSGLNRPSGYVANNYIALGSGPITGTIVNNVMGSIIDPKGSYVANNTFISDNVGEFTTLFAATENNTVTNNLFVYASAIPAGNAQASLNTQGVDANTLFDDQGTFTSDSRYKLASGSPALGAGVDGVDCGMYGGAAPYVLSGLPDVPSVYFLNAATAGSTTSGLSVHVKAKSNK